MAKTTSSLPHPRKEACALPEDTLGHGLQIDVLKEIGEYPASLRSWLWLWFRTTTLPAPHTTSPHFKPPHHTPSSSVIPPYHDSRGRLYLPPPHYPLSPGAPPAHLPPASLAQADDRPRAQRKNPRDGGRRRALQPSHARSCLRVIRPGHPHPGEREVRRSIMCRNKQLTYISIILGTKFRL